MNQEPEKSPDAGHGDDTDDRGAPKPSAISLVTDTVKLWLDRNAPTHSAALAFYTLFSMAPVLIVAISIAGLLFGTETARYEVSQQIEQLLGEQTAQAVVSVLESADRPELAGWAGIMGLGALFLGATAVFAQLQDALNLVWEVESERSALRALLIKRLLSFGLVLSLGFLLLVSLVASATISALSQAAQRRWEALSAVFSVLDFLVSLGLITLLFAILYRLLPDVDISWREVWVGAGVTAALFVVGKFLIGWYLGRSDAASVYGAGGSLVLSLFWIYYSSMLLLAGACFTRVWSDRYRNGSLPPLEEGARRTSS